MLRPGFTFLEVLLVISILGIMTMGAVPTYRDFLIRSDLDNSTAQVTQGLGRARLLAQSNKEDSAWGFYVPAGILFKGENYGTRDTIFDEVYPMPSTITAEGPTEIVYSRLVGVPSATGTIILTTISAEQRSIVIEVKQESLAVIQNDTITVCHATGGGEHTLTIPDSAWPAHQTHGDHYGACAGSSSSSSVQSSSLASSVASSVASSASSSSAISSAVSSAGVPTCVDRFIVGADGVITTLGSLSVTYSVLGSVFTYGTGGPDIDITVSASKRDNQKLKDLFSGHAINGQTYTDTLTGLVNGSSLVTSFNAYFKRNGWLTYDHTYGTGDGFGHIQILRDGATPPSAVQYGGSASVQPYLQGILDAQGKIDIGAYEAVLLAEMGTCLNCASTDYQDAVVKMSFSAPSNCN